MPKNYCSTQGKSNYFLPPARGPFDFQRSLKGGLAYRGIFPPVKNDFAFERGLAGGAIYGGYEILIRKKHLSQLNSEKISELRSLNSHSLFKQLLPLNPTFSHSKGFWLRGKRPRPTRRDTHRERFVGPHSQNPKICDCLKAGWKRVLLLLSTGMWIKCPQNYAHTWTPAATMFSHVFSSKDLYRSPYSIGFYAFRDIGRNSNFP